MESSDKLQARPNEASKATTFNLLATSILASLGSFNFGYNLSVVNTTAKTFRNCATDSNVWSCFPVDSISWGFVAGIMCAGALVGSFIAGPIADRLGRRKCILSNNIPYILGFLVLAFSQNYYMLLLGRFLVGVGVGGACIAVPLYLTEISTVTARGFIGSLHQMGIGVGLLTAEVVPLFGLYREFYWRIMFGLAAIPCLVQIIGMISLAPESPRFLFANQKFDAGRKVLQFLRAADFSEDEYNEMVRAAAGGSTASGKTRDYPPQGQQDDSWSLIDLLYRRISESGKSMLVASTLHIGQQVSGINTVLLFSDSIFAAPAANGAAAASSSVSLVPVSIAALNLLMTIAAISVIDKAGRRFLALTSSGVMFLAGVALTVAFVFGLKIVSIISVLAFVGSFAFGLGPVPWLMTNELFPTAAVGSAVTFAVGLNWISNLSVTVSFPSLSLILGNYAFMPYAICMLAFFIFSYVFLPETKGRPVAFI